MRLCRAFVVAVALLLLGVVARASVPYKQRPCPKLWNWRRSDDTCHRLYPNLHNNVTTAVLLSYGDAVAFCGSVQSSLPVITNRTQLQYFISLVGKTSGVSFWIGVKADPSFKRPPQRWQTIQQRSDGIYYDWDRAQHMPGYENCIAVQMRGDGVTRGGGNNRMVTLDCALRASVVCSRPRLVASLNGVEWDVPRRIELTWHQPKQIRFIGQQIPRGTMVTMQTTRNVEDATTPNQPTHCLKVNYLTGAATPLLLNITTRRYSGLCNGTCDEGTVMFPSSWPWVRGARYSFCFFTPFPFATPRVPAEFAQELLGPAAYLEVTQSYTEYLTDICNRRLANVNLFYNDRRTDRNTDKVQPFYFDSPLSGGGMNPEF